MYDFWIFFSSHVGSLVGGNNLVDPTAQVGDSGVHSGGAHVAVRGTPGDNTDKRPHTAVLADQRATGVTLKCQNTRGGLGPLLCLKVIFAMYF